VSRRTFVFVNGKMYEKGVDEIPENPLQVRSQLADGVLWGDRHYDGMRATDGTDISTRTKHREYMRANGLTTMDDFKGQWQQQAKERQQASITGGDHRQRRQDVIEAAKRVTEQVRRGRR